MLKRSSFIAFSFTVVPPTVNRDRLHVDDGHIAPA
jgi:hypothetical protein